MVCAGLCGQLRRQYRIAETAWDGGSSSSWKRGPWPDIASPRSRDAVNILFQVSASRLSDLAGDTLPTRPAHAPQRGARVGSTSRYRHQSTNCPMSRRPSVQLLLLLLAGRLILCSLLFCMRTFRHCL